MEEFRQLKKEEQQIYGDSDAVWDKCIVHGLFSAQPDMQMIQEQLRLLTDGPPLQLEAGSQRLLSMACFAGLSNTQSAGCLAIQHRSGSLAIHSLICPLC